MQRSTLRFANHAQFSFCRSRLMPASFQAAPAGLPTRHCGHPSRRDPPQRGERGKADPTCG